MEQSSPPLPVQPPASAVGGNSPRHHWFLVVFYGLAVVWGIRNVHFWKESSLDFLVPWVMAVALGWWAVSDARRHGRPIPILVRQWFVLLVWLFVPGYLLWSRKGWGGVLLILHTLGWCGLAIVVMQGGGIIVFGEDWWRVMSVPRPGS